MVVVVSVVVKNVCRSSEDELACGSAMRFWRWIEIVSCAASFLATRSLARAAGLVDFWNASPVPQHVELMHTHGRVLSDAVVIGATDLYNQREVAKSIYLK